MKKTGKAEEKFIREVKKNFKKAMRADEHNRREAIEDLKFINGDQWGSEAAARQADGRPSLTFNLLDKFVAQLVGDQRLNRTRIKIIPEAKNSDILKAKILAGKIKHIENKSKAEAIYDQAFEMVAKCGYGAWRVLTRYKSEKSFEKEIYLEAVRNPFAVYLDPDCKDTTGADAEFGFLLTKMTHEEFKELYPDAEDPTEIYEKEIGLNNENWYEKDLVLIAEYFVKERKKKIIELMSDGSIREKSKENKKEEEKEKSSVESGVTSMPQPMQNIPPDAGLPATPPAPPSQAMGNMPMNIPPVNPPMMQMMKPELTVIDERETEETVVKHYVLCGNELLSEEEDWPGKYIPLVPVYGKETNIEGKRHIKSLIRDGKDEQRMFNYWRTLSAETIALAPKAPIAGTPKQFEGFEKDWENANRKNNVVLRFNVDPLMPNGKPERMQPATPPMAIFSEIERSEAGLEAILGMYKSTLGAPSNERSGVAIESRKRESDVGQFEFADNLKRAIAHTGNILVDLIPKIYDTEQIMRIVGENGTEFAAPVNTTVINAAKMMRDTACSLPPDMVADLQNRIKEGAVFDAYNKLDDGDYGVVIETGPSYSTQRMENVNNILKLVQVVPRIGEIGADILLKNMDFFDAEELSLRFRKTLQPGLATPTAEDRLNPPLPPNPMMMAKVQESIAKAMKMKAEAMRAVTEAQGNDRDEIKKLVLDTMLEVFGGQQGEQGQFPSDMGGMGGFDGFTQ